MKKSNVRIVYLFVLFLVSGLAGIPGLVSAQNQPPTITTFLGVNCIGPDDNWPGGAWMKDPEKDELQLYTDVHCVSNGAGPEIWPYENGDTFFPIPVGDQYITWQPPECGSCRIKLTVYQVNDPSLYDEAEFTLYRPCPEDPPNCECVLDACGICNGDGTSCEGEPTPTPDPSPTPDPTPESCDGVVDECGVCAGDGSTCSCTTSDTSEFSFVLDSNAAGILKSLKSALRRTRKLECISNRKRKKLLRRGEELYIDSWLFANTIPREDMACGAAIECQTFELQGLYKQVLKRSKGLVKTIKRTRKQCGLPDKSLNLRVQAGKGLHKKMKKYVKTLPEALTACMPK